MDNVDAFDFTAELPANASQQQAWLWEQQSVQPELLEQGNGTLAQTDAHVKANHGVSNGNSSWRATSRRMGLTNRHGIGKRVSTTSMCSMAVRRVVNAALCPICAEPVKEAFLTPCGHTFCHGCLIKHLRASNRSTCPECGAYVTADKIVPNMIVSKLVDEVRSTLDDELIRANNINKTEHEKNLHSAKKRLRTETEDAVDAEGIIPDSSYRNDTGNISNLQSGGALARAMNCVRWMGVDELEAMTSVLDGRRRDLEDQFLAGGIDVLGEFLSRCRERKRGELRLLQSRLSVLDGHIAAAEGAIGNGNVPVDDMDSGNGIDFSIKRKQISEHLDELRGTYLQCGVSGGEGLSGFCEKFSTFLRRLQCIAKLDYNSESNAHSRYRTSSNIVSSIEFDAGEERFATAGVSKRIHVYDFDSLISNDNNGNHLLLDLGTRSKLSCLSWCKFAKNQLASSDYEGIVNVWDVEKAQSFIEYEEHEKRVWTVDFSRTSCPMMVSGSDDGKVKVWSVTQPNSVCTIDMRANVCCVKYNPATHHQVAVGCADHNVHIFDLRKIGYPLEVLSGHKKAVSYVRYASSTEVVSASTDGTLRVWEVGGDKSVKTLSGHTNEKNFVGLSVTSQFVCCGSETNDVYVYYKHVSRPLAKYNFNNDDFRQENENQDGERNNNINSAHVPLLGGASENAGNLNFANSDNSRQQRQQQQQQQQQRQQPNAGRNASETNQFISSLCWKGESSVLLASNSQGSIRAITLE